MFQNKASRCAFLGAAAGSGSLGVWAALADPHAGRPYHKHKFRVEKDGHIPAPAEPGLGYPIDHDALDKLMIRIDR